MKVLVNSIEPTGKLGAEENSHLKVFFGYDLVSAKSNRRQCQIRVRFESSGRPFFMALVKRF